MYNALWDAALIVLGILLFACLIRCVLGPRVSDRIVAVNMTGTLVILMIAVLSLRLKEDYLTDVALLYATLSFLAVVLLTKIYMGLYLEKKRRRGDDA